MNRYMVNGWKEGKSYFMRLGRFTEDEMERLMSGEVIIKGSNEFYIDTEEE